MLLFIKFFAAIAGMSLIIPLCVWGMSGRLSDALHAWRTWSLIVGAIFAPGVIIMAIGALIG
jgi:hypothetical protein